MAFKSKETKTLINETYSNLSTNIIQITEDKLLNIISKHFTKIKKSHDWIGSSALTITLLGMLYTSDFHQTFRFSADTIEAGFIILTMASAIYTVYTIRNCWRNKTKVDDIINDIKGEK